jgi:hypothetical protein
MKQSLKRSQVEKFALALEKAKNTKSFSDEEFNALHARFKFDDANGASWTVGIHTRKWHRRAASGWVPDLPPDSLYAEVSLIGALNALSVSHGDPALTQDSPLCPHCGVPLRPGKKFCVGCGQSIAATAPAPPPERRCARCGRIVTSKRFCGGCGSPV